MKQAGSAAELLKAFDDGNSKGVVALAISWHGPAEAVCWRGTLARTDARHVGATNMNAGSSRSHLIFGVVINSYDKQTKQVRASLSHVCPGKCFDTALCCC